MPSSAVIDLGDKAAEYLELPSLRAGIVLSQDERKAWVWSRQSSPFAPGPKPVSGSDAVVSVSALQLELRLAGIHAGTNAS